MSATSSLISGLKFSREFSLRILEELENDEDWLFKAHFQSNHALWFVGHMGISDNVAINWIDPEFGVDRPDMMNLFAMGSKPVSEASAYPPVGDVRDWMDERRAVLLTVAERLTDADLAGPPVTTAPPFIRSIEGALQFLAWHEGMHAGQIPVARRAMGYAPFIGRADGQSNSV